MPQNPRLSIVIPAYNESKRIAHTLAAIQAYLAARPDLAPAEIVVVDDGSSDGTAAVAAESRGAAAVRILRHDANQGKGAAVRTGILGSAGAKILITDADLATPIEDLVRLESSPAALALGSRVLDRRLLLKRRTGLRRLAARTYNHMMRFLGLTQMRDSQCGFKLADGGAARSIAAEMTIRGFGFDSEFESLFHARGLRVEEIGVTWSHVGDSSVRMLPASLSMAGEAFKLAGKFLRSRRTRALVLMSPAVLAGVLLLVSLGARLAAWSRMDPAPSRIYSDEISYVRAGEQLRTLGRQDTFWPPLTGWMIAGGRALGLGGLPAVRLAWVVLDSGCVLLLFAGVLRLLKDWDWRKRRRAAFAAGIFWAVYAAAVGYSVVATSEVPAAFLLLVAVLLLVGRPDVKRPTAAGAGAALGLAILARSNLLPLALIIPAALAFYPRRDGRRTAARAAAVAVAAASLLIVGAYVASNRAAAGRWTLSDNGPADFWRGNSADYRRDLKIFWPIPGKDHIRERRLIKMGRFPRFPSSPAKARREAIEFNRRKPWVFPARSIGRFARVFAPRVNQLSLVEKRRSILKAPDAALIVLANLQFLALLGFGLIGLLGLNRVSKWAQVLLSTVIAGALLLSFPAVSEPRYSFPFETALVIAGAAALADLKGFLRAVSSSKAKRRTALALAIFLAWTWAAAAIWVAATGISSYF